ncbi:MAG: sigma-70 family RNA polymerase sigma factor [Planctomycetes bacterium]|nr:sigma-70 family RNA polymerase sigma factor [Planctomycetota bacterium]
MSVESAQQLVIGADLLARLRSFIRRRVRSSADGDDVLQTVLLRFVERRGDLDPQSLPAWAFRVARVAIADLHRARARAALPDAVIAEATIAAAPQAEPGVVPDLAHCVPPLLASLPDSDQLLLRRIDLEGASQVELAREFGLSVSGMKSRTQRARARLREALLATCTTEWDARGQPTGDASCKETRAAGCGCSSPQSAQGNSPPGRP